MEYSTTRRSVRLRGYDYRQGGAYFVTICTRDRVPILSNIVDDELQLRPFGEIAGRTWRWIEEQYPDISLDAYVVMPNHVHGILVILEGNEGQTKSIGRLVGAFKTVSTKAMNAVRATQGAAFWQRSFYGHLIRNQADLDRVRTYIANNPARWAEDEEYVAW